MTVAVMPERDASFESILDAVKARFAHCLNRSYFEDQMTSHVNIERIPGIKFVPLFIKDLVMKIIYAPNASKYTMTFSNVGRINLPENISDKVERFEMMIGGSHTHPKKASLISYKDELVLMFSSTIDDNSLERYLVSFLSERGIDITISSNETPPEALSKEQMAAKAERAAAKRSSKESKSERKRLKKQDKLAKKLAKKRMKLEKKAERKALKDKKNESKKQTAAIKNASKRNKGSSSDAEVDA